MEAGAGKRVCNGTFGEPERKQMSGSSGRVKNARPLATLALTFAIEPPRLESRLLWLHPTIVEMQASGYNMVPG